MTKNPINHDEHLVVLTMRLFNAKFRMAAGESGQRARFHAVLSAIGARRRELAS